MGWAGERNGRRRRWRAAAARARGGRRQRGDVAESGSSASDRAARSEEVSAGAMERRGQHRAVHFEINGIQKGTESVQLSGWAESVDSSPMNSVCLNLSLEF